MTKIHNQVIGSPVVHFDETGTKMKKLKEAAMEARRDAIELEIDKGISAAI